MSELLDNAVSGDVGKVKQLLAANAQVDYIDECGYTALHLAAENGHENVVETLLDAGANINQVTFHTEFTPLHFAISKNHWAAADILIKAGADLDLVNQAGCYGSSLHSAITKANADLVKTLVKKGADVNLYSDQGFTPLLLASSLDLTEICRLLIVTGANVNDVDEDGKTSLHVAAANGFGQLVKILSDAGADFGLKDSGGNTPADSADKCKENEIAEFLRTCESGNGIPSQAPKGKVKESREFRTIDPIEGCGEGCAVPP